VEAKFTKSQTNKGTENKGLALLLSDPRFRSVDTLTKRAILAAIGASGAFGPQTFDAVMLPDSIPPLTPDNASAFVDRLRLVEMKTTRKPIKNKALAGFFFGATEREYAMAKALGDRFLFAFVVLNAANDYGMPFAVLLTADEVEERTASKRVQYQVNFRSTLVPESAPVKELIVFGDETHIPTSGP
jgi:hypothetical protein